MDSVIYVLAFGFYLFNDFAGYTSIVRGVSGLLGIELSANFLTPYFSRSFTEFWNQWHITLSEWLRDYIYFPLTRFFLRHNSNPRFVLTLVIPPLVTMLVSGMWHGLTLTLLLWGGLHGLALVIERVLLAFRAPRRPDQYPVFQQILSGAFVFGVVMLAWIPFTVTGPIRLRNYLESIARPGLSTDALPVFNFIIFSLVIDIFQNRTKDELFFLKWPMPAQVALLTATCLLLVLMSTAVIPEFVYQGF
jgi:D-alanyl-lipoteichoic acid acyltransferase DltB (MBOAT superfamily)